MNALRQFLQSRRTELAEVKEQIKDLGDQRDLLVVRRDALKAEIEEIEGYIELKETEAP